MQRTDGQTGNAETDLGLLNFPAGALITPGTPRTEQELRLSHSRMLAALNHEIRTPLTGILGMADLLLETALSQEQKEYVDSTRLCAENLLESLSNALEFSAVSSGDLQLVDSGFHLQEVIRAAIGNQNRRSAIRNVGILLELDPGLPEVLVGDGVRLRQILSILLSYAVKVSLQSEIVLAVSSFQPFEGEEIALSLSVTDNGPDLPPARLTKLFESPDYSAYSHANLELGLPLASQLAQAMGGILEAEAVPGSGTLFAVTLPFRSQDQPTVPKAVAALAPAAQTRLLLVEDNEVAQRFMRTVLERKGYHVKIAPGGQEAIDILRQEEFDLVLMDVQMPFMDGLEATRRIRKMFPGKPLPIVACTANTSSDVQLACQECGMNDFVAKPVQTAELIEVLNRNLGRVANTLQ